jgi:hypothetical protein
METLATLVPVVDALLALSPEEIGPLLIRIARQDQERGMFHPNNLANLTTDSYRSTRAREVATVVSEGWEWLRGNGFIVPAPGTNGSHGWMVFGRRAESLAASDEILAGFRAAASFPKSLLHRSFAEKVWLKLARGEFADAVFDAFKAVEEAVRLAGNYSLNDFGVDLMRKAFHKLNGPLTDLSQPEPEREALAHLFAGAIGF